MHKDWIALIEKYDPAGARGRFENICNSLFSQINPGKNVKAVDARGGDGGVDIFVGDYPMGNFEVIQCKFFQKLGDAQKKQTRDSFRTVINNYPTGMTQWTLCIPMELNPSEHQWWAKWIKDMQLEHQLGKYFIQLQTGNEIIDQLNQAGLYTHAFEKEDSNNIKEILSTLKEKDSDRDIERYLASASSALFGVKNFINDQPSTHQKRTQVRQILDWISEPIAPKKKNILILKGEKGMGKSVILKDVYDQLNNEDQLVLGIKADQFYAVKGKELEEKLFFSHLSFRKLESISREFSKKFVIIIDQIDALSQTLSANREFIQTYNRLIAEFKDVYNVRIIVACRTFDLEHDAELNIYNEPEYEKVVAEQFSKDEVVQILKVFHKHDPPDKIMDLLRTPNHLGIYCKLPDPDLAGDSLSSLKDLYDELWKQVISPRKDLKVKELLFTVSKCMYDTAEISVSNIYQDEFLAELQFLHSHSLLISHGKSLSHFHQTFYEYCLARWFVENGYSLQDYIHENKQSLYVRSVVKMVAEYLREYDLKSYLEQLYNILSNKTYRFHLQSLLLTDFACYKQPQNLERKFFYEKILGEHLHEELFISSVTSPGWIHFFMDHHFLRHYLLDGSLSKNLRESLVLRNVNFAPLQVLQYLESVELNDKIDLIKNTLTFISDWSDQNLLPYFELYINIPTIADGIRYRVLENIAKHHPLYTLSLIEGDFSKSRKGSFRSTWFSFDLDHLIKSIYQIDPKAVFETLFTILQETLTLQSKPYFTSDDIPSPLNDSWQEFNLTELDTLSKDRSMEGYLARFLIHADNDWFLRFFDQYKSSNEIPLLSLLSMKLRTAAVVYADQSFELILLLRSKFAFDGKDDEFQVELRKLIATCYPYFNDYQRQEIRSFLLQMKSSYDIYSYEGFSQKRCLVSQYGLKKYRFLKAIGKSFMYSDPLFKGPFMQLERRFGDIDPCKASNPSKSWSRGGVVRAPLPQRAYDHMSHDQWKDSMYKFDRNYRSKDFLFGDIQQHSSAFKAAVKSNPSKFFPLVLDLFDNSKIEMDYLEAGLSGLAEGKFTPQKVMLLLKRFIQLNLDPLYQLYACWISRYLFESQVADKAICHFLQSVALDFSRVQQNLSNKDLSDENIMEVNGAAVDALFYGCYSEEFKDIILHVVDNILAYPYCTNTIKSSILHDVAYLIRLDKEKAFDFFIRLTSGADKKLLTSSFYPARYFYGEYRDRMQRYFDAVLAYPDILKNAYVFVNCWINDSVNDKDLYDKFVNTGPYARQCALAAVEGNLHKDNSLNLKCVDILHQFINDEDDEVVSSYSAIILRKFKEEDFKDLYSFLRAYAPSRACVADPSYFLQYLIQCSRNYPADCLELLLLLTTSHHHKLGYLHYWGDEPINLVLSIYSKLNSYIFKDEHLINRCLDIYDALLKAPHNRFKASEAIDKML